MKDFNDWWSHERCCCVLLIIYGAMTFPINPWSILAMWCGLLALVKFPE